MIIIALGSNLRGNFGPPGDALRKAVNELSRAGIKILDISRMYITKAHAKRPQPDYYNAIVTAATSLPADSLLEVLKRIEAQAGRGKSKRAGAAYLRWMPRPLDLDVVSYKGIVRNWRARRPSEGRRVILPHPRAHERAFVLAPLGEIAPYWHHPVTGLTPAQMMKRPKVRETGKIKHSLKF
jgi:2-amino-4-hydroxy-6-hydroxymethyldihydropteridine diphosphokinase